jgi:gliding motility-associated-like protein
LYSIDNLNYSNSNTFKLPSGIHYFYARDVKGCIQKDSIQVGLNNNLKLNTRPDTTICEGDNLKLLSVSNAQDFLWTPNTSLDNPLSLSPTATPTTTTKYTIDAKEGFCEIADTVTITVNKAPIPNAGIDETICYLDNTTLNGSGGNQYFWQPTSAVNNPNIPNPKTIIAQSTLFVLSVINNLGCKSLVSDSVFITKRAPVNANAGIDTVVYYNTSVFFNGSGGNKYSWSPSNLFSNPFILNPTIFLKQTQLFKLEVIDSDNCKGYDDRLVEIYEPLEIPNIFTPNNDGKNDVFKVTGGNFSSKFNMKIFNRYGQFIFESNDLSQFWDGRYKGQPVDVGAYVYLITYNDKVLKQSIIKKGTVMLVR